MFRSICQASIGLFLLLIFIPLTLAQTTMTYQGQLQEGGNPVDGETVNLYFELYDDPDPAVGTLVSDDGPFTVAVENGLFQVDLNFGDVNFTVAKYLRIQVNGEWLDGTQEITTVPLAQYSLGAQSVYWSGVLNAPEFWRLGGNAGTTPGTDFIGTSDDQAFEIHVNASRGLRIEPALHPTNGSHLPNVVGGASSNQASSYANVVGGGEGNAASGARATVGGGHRNTASGLNSTVGGGHNNEASASYSTVAGGNNSTAAGFYSAIGGGDWNLVEGRFGVISGGGWTDTGDRPNSSNVVHDNYGTIGGGGNNRAGSDDGVATTAPYATIGGGSGNSAVSTGTTISGGIDNQAGGLGPGATVGGGESNAASNSHATVAGGISNIATGNRASIGGGDSNFSQGFLGFIGGGYNNDIGSGAQHATISGGRENVIENSADGGTIPGGEGARATHYGEQAYASGYFVQPGDAQASTFVLRNTTTDNATTELFLDGAGERLEVEADRTVAFEVLIVARDIDSSTAHAWKSNGLIFTNSSGTNTQFWGNPNTNTTDIDGDPTWAINFRADDVANALVIEVTGALNTNIRWVARVETVEVAGL